MLKLRLYITGAAFIAPAVTGSDLSCSDSASSSTPKRLAAVEPDYTGLIPPMQLRRMSKGVRMGIGAGAACLANAGAERPDAIVVGTALGCLHDTEIFLGKMVAQDEQMLTPTSFIQSTHNTVAGQMALTFGCRGFNTTVSQCGHSFEGAVINAALHLTEHPADKVLCGGVDELTETSFQLLQRGGYYTDKTIGGEGAGFLLLSHANDDADYCITGLSFFAEKSADPAAQKLEDILGEARQERDSLYLDVRNKLRPRLQSFWQGEVLEHDAPGGQWETSVAIMLSRLALKWPTDRRCIWLARDAGCGDYAVWRIERTKKETVG